MTYYKFMALYQAYKDTFDVEMMLTASGTTYRGLREKQMRQNMGWF